MKKTKNWVNSGLKLNEKVNLYEIVIQILLNQMYLGVAIYLFESLT